MTMTIHPLANVEPIVVDGVHLWRFQNEDPQFILVGAAERGFLAGWNVLSCRLRAAEGNVASPCLYPDYGSGYSEEERIDLPEPDAAGQLRVLVRFKRRPVALRLDPSTTNAVALFEHVRLRHVGKIAAFAHMVRSIAARAGTAEAVRLAAVAMKAVAAGDSTRAGDALYERYRHGDASTGFPGYAEWLARYDQPLTREESKRRLAAMQAAPLVSVLMPTFNTPERWLRAAIESVRRQSYPHWELCIADDASSSRETRAVLAQYAAIDPRIRVALRDRNGHISAASNTALDSARGEWIALLDHDDALHPDALLHVVEAILGQPDAVLVYTDEDKIDERDQRYQPYFKPAYDPDLLLGQNFICHFAVYRASSVREAGCFREGFEGAQDWDLALRVVRSAGGDSVLHVPRVLYHWRAIGGSTALGSSEKDYASDAGTRAVAVHLREGQVSARVKPLPGGHLRIERQAPDPQPSVVIVIPTRDRVALLRQCVDSILSRTTYANYRIAIVDNGSVEPETFEYLSQATQDPRVQVIAYPKPFNYSAINNFAVAAVPSEIVALVNNDIEVISPDWLETMVAHALRPDVGAVGAMLYYPDDTVQHAGVTVGFGGVAGHAFSGAPRGSDGYMGRMRLTGQATAVTAACLLVRRQVWDEVGGLDEDLPVAFNDVDFCLRIAARGYRNIWTPEAELYHHESATRGYEDTPEKQRRFQGEVAFMQERWGELLQADPNYNPNLALAGRPFSLAFPPRPRRPRNNRFG